MISDRQENSLSQWGSGFEDAYQAFAEVARLGEEAGADLIHIETMSDTYEVKTAVLAAKENTSLPVFATMILMTKENY